MSHVDIEVRDEGGGPVAPGQPGELAVRGPNTCVGYFDDPERTASTFVDGWVLSGDLVAEDVDGYVTVVGRKKEIIIRGGLNITPREIEEMLTLFPEVERAAVVGLPDERLGERMCACVIPRRISMPNSASRPRIMLTSCVRCLTKRSRVRWTVSAACCSQDLIATYRIVGSAEVGLVHTRDDPYLER